MINIQIHKYNSASIDKNQIYSPFKCAVLKDLTPIEVAIKNPKTIYTEKYQLPLWTFYTPKNAFTVFDKYNNPIGDSDNFDYLEMLQVEYDANKMKIEDFKKRYSNYTYYLYTTWSHDKFNVSFRVMFPLAKKIPVGYFNSTCNKEIMYDLFPKADKSAFQSFHKQKIPACHIDNLSKYEWHINHGELFDIDHELFKENYEDFIITQERLRSTAFMPLDYNDKYYNIKGLYVPRFIEDCVKDKCDRIMSNTNFNIRKTGTVHSTLLEVYGKMRTSGFEKFEVISWMKDRAPKECHKEIEDFHKMN